MDESYQLCPIKIVKGLFIICNAKPLDNEYYLREIYYTFINYISIYDVLQLNIKELFLLNHQEIKLNINKEKHKLVKI